MNVQHVILGFLMDERMSGYDIKRRFEVSVSNFFDASFGGIYPALRKMEKDGWITKEVVIQEGKPNKNVFAITELGKQAFYEYLASPSDPTVIRCDFLVRIFFAKYATQEQIRTWITQEFARAQESYQQLCTTKEQVGDCLEPFKALTLEYGIARAEFDMDWIKRLAREQGMEEELR